MAVYIKIVKGDVCCDDLLALESRRCLKLPLVRKSADGFVSAGKSRCEKLSPRGFSMPEVYLRVLPIMLSFAALFNNPATLTSIAVMA
jgi:hypothetical protein